MSSLFLFISAWGLLWGMEFQGKAYDIKTGRLLYLENHKTQQDSSGLNKLIETEYVSPEGQLFAKIRSDFSKDQFIPDVIFEDFSKQIKEVQVYDIQKKEITIVKTYLKTSKTKQHSFPLKTNMLGGQGFNNFLLARFDELMNGKSVHVNFIVLSSQDFFQFDIKRKHEAKNGKIDFGLSVSSYILKIFVKEINVTYDVESKRLLFFQGLSNLSDEKGNPMKVKIEYEYK